MRQIRLTRPGLDFFHDKAFAECRTVLDSEMKRLKREGVVVKGRKAEPLTEEEEQILWDKGILGDHSPHALLNTVFFQNGINFALRSGGEHRSLRNTSNGCQIRVFEPEGQRARLIYREDASKNNQGGLRGRKQQPKEVVQYANTEERSRCPVRIFKLYTSLCPDNVSTTAFYLQPFDHHSGFHLNPCHNTLNHGEGNVLCCWDKRTATP